MYNVLDINQIIPIRNNFPLDKPRLNIEMNPAFSLQTAS